MSFKNLLNDMSFELFATSVSKPLSTTACLTVQTFNTYLKKGYILCFPHISTKEKKKKKKKKKEKVVKNKNLLQKYRLVL